MKIRLGQELKNHIKRVLEEHKELSITFDVNGILEADMHPFGMDVVLREKDSQGKKIIFDKDLVEIIEED